MAEIEQYLEQFLKLEESHQKVYNEGTSAQSPFTRRSNETYKLQDEDFIIKDKKSELIQYATFYWLRLQSLRPHVKEMAEFKWGDDDPKFVNNILDIKPSQQTVIIGTLFKEQPLKPSILKNIVGVLGTRKFTKGLYSSEEDFAVLEDSSGRIRLKKSDKFDPQHYVTGSIMAFIGTADTNGFFTIKDLCYAGVPFQSMIPKSVNLNLERDLYDEGALKSDKREFVAFISGLEFGVPGDVISAELFLRFIRGELGGVKNQKLSSQISRVIVCGNSIIQPEETDTIMRGSYRTHNVNLK